MDQRHLARGVKEMSGSVGHPRGCKAKGHPARYAKIRHPGFAAELAALDLQRLLPTEIARLLVGEDFLRIGVRVDGPQFFQTITSFSRSMPKAMRTRPRTSSINLSMS